VNDQSRFQNRLRRPKGVFHQKQVFVTQRLPRVSAYWFATHTWDRGRSCG
jgi:hypothetical protein